MRLKPQAIESEVQLLVEGRDTKGFFEALTSHLALENLQIQDFGGIGDLRTFLPAFVKLSDFSIVSSIGIVRDAENNASGAFESVRGSLERAGLPVPDAIARCVGDHPAVAVMILPGQGQPGMLETLLCETIREEAVDPCIDSFFKCVTKIQGEPPQRPYKARARAFLATTQDPHLSVGVAAKRGYWNLNHLALEPVRSFLRSIAAPL